MLDSEKGNVYWDHTGIICKIQPWNSKKLKVQPCFRLSLQLAPVARIIFLHKDGSKENRHLCIEKVGSSWGEALLPLQWSLEKGHSSTFESWGIDRPESPLVTPFKEKKHGPVKLGSNNNNNNNFFGGQAFVRSVSWIRPFSGVPPHKDVPKNLVQQNLQQVVHDTSWIQAGCYPWSWMIRWYLHDEFMISTS